MTIRYRCLSDVICFCMVVLCGMIPVARGDAPTVLKLMGIGLGGYNYYACSLFADTIHSSREWIEYAPSQWGNPILDSGNPQFDSNGFPRYLNADRRLRLLLWPYVANYYQRPSA